mgnify:CR=1 FL=1
MDNTEVFEKYESEVRSYCRIFDEELDTAKGAIIKDVNGKEYIDFFCGAGALNYGHNNDYIKERVVKYLEHDGIMHALDMYTKPKEEFIKYFEEEILKPRGLDYKIQFPGPTGTNAIEAALKLARKVKGRRNIWCLMGCFHGMTLGALELTTEAAARKGAGVEGPFEDFMHEEMNNMLKVVKPVLEQIKKSIDEDIQVYTEGANKSFEFPEFKDLEVARNFVNILDTEKTKKLIGILNNDNDEDEIKVYIGDENINEALKDFSVITFKHKENGQDLGTIAIIGPTRMDYSKVISAMKFISKKLNEKSKNILDKGKETEDE